ncbi:MAG TPA: DJ-1 family glyoxalase III [Thermodesulfobacteriota bacterium]|nr:DJ-1 family glyoxalase III [Thermodesulfobacteriota bacterium]
MKKVLIPLLEGFEEVEAMTVVDVLRRAGADVLTAGASMDAIEGRNKIKVLPDASLKNMAGKDFDLIVLPGGAKGTENLKKNKDVRGIVLEHFKKGRLIAAICAAPTVLSMLGITKGKTITSHPSARDELKDEKISDERVVVDENLVTSQSPGTAMEFAFVLVEALFGREKAREVNKGVMAKIQA